ncbi:MAG: IS3 family transposase [Terriglobales bacterium]
MSEKRRKFSPQFKAEAVQMVIETGKPIAEVARDLGVHDGTLGNWVTAWRDENPEPKPDLSPMERARVKELEEENRRLRMENEFLKKGRGLLRPDAAVAERCVFIESEKANYRVTWMCRMLTVPRSSYYAWRGVAESLSAARRRELAREVARLFDESRQTSGCRRIAAALARQGRPVSVGLVASIMRELGLKAVQPRAYKRTTVPGEDPVESPDLIAREFAAGPDGGAPGSRLVGDITYLRTGEGWLYLATVIDLTSRMVVGWQLAAHMRTNLVTEALRMAIDAGRVAPQAIFHSDRGTQYTSHEFARFCRKKGIRTSLGRTGVCWDNAVAESFFAALKNEMYYRTSFPTRARARFAVAEYIEIFYNRKRLHSSIDYRTPYEAFTDHLTAATAA